MRLTPYGMFAVAAVAAGTLQIEQLARIQVYLMAYVAISLLLTAWVLPGLVAALTPIRYLDLVRTDARCVAHGVRRRRPVHRAAIADRLVQGAARRVLRAAGEHRRDAARRHRARLVQLPAHGQAAVAQLRAVCRLVRQRADAVHVVSALALTGLLTFFGSLSAAVPFLLDVFRIPADTFQLFLATGVINQRFGSLLAAVHTVVVALLGSAAIAGTMRFEPRRVVRYLVITGVLIVVTVGGLRVMFRTLLLQEFKGAEIVYGMTNLLEHDPTRVVPQFAAEGARAVGARSVFARAARLRVCFAVAAAAVRVP